jgi:dTDP-4-dehydrorhamnose reductase
VSDDDHLDRVLAEPRTGGPGFDYVVNLAAETAHGKSEEMYNKMVAAAGKLGAAAAASGVCRKFIHVSTAQVYKGDKSRASKEDSPVAPWTVQAEYMLRSEDAVKVRAGWRAGGVLARRR